MAALDRFSLSKISRPSRYLGNEVNAVRKDLGFTKVSVALVFPDVYEVGMSHLGLKILYHALNRQDWLAAERAFSPWPDLEQQLREKGRTPTTLESDRPLSSFDIIGFSLPHELSYSNILNMLDLSKIPFLARERSAESPLVIAGGSASFNPEPVAELFDLIVIGDGEAATLEICEMVRDAKSVRSNSKKELLSRLSGIRGIYVPSQFSIRYSPQGAVDKIESMGTGRPFVEKAILPDLDDSPYPDHPVVPFTELVHDRVAVEISRGCTRGCRFCQAGMVYRPVRERRPESILEITENVLAHTGYEDLSLLSLSSGDYCCILPLLRTLMDQQAEKKVAVSFPSLRVDSLDSSLIEQIKRVRKTGFTLAPEAGNERLRQVINKGLTQREILETASKVYGAGWNLIKLYFMIGLPSETDGDLYDIIGLAQAVAKLAGKRGRRAKLNVSISTFVPKAHTPFQWSSQISIEESRRRIKLIQDGLKGARIRVKWNQPELSWLEGIFSRGDRRLLQVLVEAQKLGAKFDAWADHFDPGIWEAAFRRASIDPRFYLARERHPDEVMPWDHIRSGVRKAFLKRELEKSRRAETTPDCRDSCIECGVCDHNTVDPVLHRSWDGVESAKKPLESSMAPASSTTYRLTFTKLADARYLSHLELVRVFVRAFRRAEIDMVYSKGFHPMPKLKFLSALPLGTESVHETLDIEVFQPTQTVHLKRRVNRQLPAGIAVTSVEEISPQDRKKQIKKSHFLIELNGTRLDVSQLEGFLKTAYFPVTKASKKNTREVNARPLVDRMSRLSPNGISLIMNHACGYGLKPAQIAERVFSLKGDAVDSMKILKTRQVLG